MKPDNDIYCVVTICRWTKKQTIYPVVYYSKNEADKKMHILNNENNTAEVRTISPLQT